MPARKKTTEKEKTESKEKKVSKTGTRKSTKKSGDEKGVTKSPSRRKSTAKGDKNLVIVESPAKDKTIQKYLGPGFEVAASYGHVRDLPKKPKKRGDIGIDIEAGWVPTYTVIEEANKRFDKKTIIADLKKRSNQAAIIYLAPDPDREGEAIAWHLKETLNLDEDRVRRITFNEITKNAVQNALEHSGTIDMDRVRAQEARRFLDRAVGYKLSPLLSKKMRAGLSAGRVQSVAVRMVVERELEIQAFKSEEFWKITAQLSPEQLKDAAEIAFRVLKKDQKESEESEEQEETEGEDNSNLATGSLGLKFEPGKSFLAELAEWDGGKFKAENQEAASEIAGILEKSEFVVSKVEQKDRQEKPQAPFTTSTLQQQSSRRLRFTGKTTMQLAQRLYEGIELGSEGSVALITYMRTDSTRVSDGALKGVREHIDSNYGKNYLPDKANKYSSGKSAQEAHEAIRPTDISYTPEKVAPYLNPPQLALYELIYRRFVASQMKPAIFAVTNVEITAAKGLLKSQGKILKFDGYRKVLAPTKSKQEDALLPPLEEKQPLSLWDLVASQHFTQPPPRYNEASLVKTLEREGIGRPSTYATIIDKIQEKGYVELKERRFYATQLGLDVTKQLIAHFPKVMDIKFTSQLEEELDQIEEAKAQWREVLDNFWGPFSKALEEADENMQKMRGEETGEECPKCGSPLVSRYSRKRKGKKFVGCKAYPDCEYIKPEEGEDGKPLVEETEYKCPTCDKMMLKRQGPRGPFLGCSGYPECKTTMNFDAEGNPVLASKPTEHTCEKCGKEMVLREGRRGPFLGCTGYPKCRNIKEVDEHGNPVEPFDTGIKCEKCDGPMHIKPGPRGPFLGCSNYPKCRSTKRMTDELREKFKDHLPAAKPKQEMPKVEIEETCPECGEAMELRRGRRGFFLGCTQFGKTKCKGTKEVPAEVMEQIENQQQSAS